MKKDYQFKALFFRVFAALCFFFISQAVHAQVSGKVFRDFNSNGQIDSTASFKEIGQIGIIVKAYNASGVEVGTATTDKNGKYTILGVSGPLRIEFSNLPNSDFSSFSGGTSVQFVNGGTTNVNFGINLPNDYCQANPDIVTICYASQDVAPATDKVMIKFPLNYSLDPDGNVNGTTTQGTASYGQVIYTPKRPDPSGIGVVSQIGSTWGVAYDKVSKKLYTSAYVRRGTRMGPTESTGAIYVVTDVANSSAPQLFVDLNTVFGANTTGANPHPFATTSWNGGNWDLNTLNKVGKVGFGDIEMSKDGTTLYAVNLADKKIYEIPTSGPLNSTTIKRYDIPTTGLPVVTNAAGATGTANAVDIRPFGLGFDKSGNLYVGAVHSCESISAGVDTDPNPASYQMTAYVWKFINGVFTLVLNESLRFDRDNSGDYKTFDNTSSDTNNFDWEPWSNVDNYSNQQPMLTDIDFTDSKMILGFRDRNADQSFGPNGGGGYQSSGDIYMACLQGSVWKFEQAGGCDGLQSTRGSNKQGPGGGEFFEDTQGDGIVNGGIGGIAVLQGYGVFSTTTDAVVKQTNGTFLNNVSAAGVQLYDFTTGNYKGGYDVYYKGNSQASAFAKAAGLGDIEILCNVAPLEIGNRVWNDTDKDGIQDAGENGIQNVTIELYADFDNDGVPDGAALATTPTSATGTWYFNDGNVADGDPATVGTQKGLAPNKNYLIRVGSTDWTSGVGAGDLVGLSLTTANATSSGLTDVADSDASLVSNIPTIAYTTGDYGQNNHTLDMGFYTKPICEKPNAGSDLTFCQPSDSKYKLNDAPSGQTWIKYTGSSSIDATTGAITGLTAGINEYILKYTNSTECADTINLVVIPTPSSDITILDVVCANGKISTNASFAIVNQQNVAKFDYVSGATFTGTKSYASLPNTTPASSVITLPNPTVTKNYTIRLYNQGGTCFTDKTVELRHIDCPLVCPPNTCLPIGSVKN